METSSYLKEMTIVTDSEEKCPVMDTNDIVDRSSASLTFRRVVAIISNLMSTPRDRAAVAASGLFRNLGTALLLMRGLRRWVFEDLLAARGR